MPVHTALQVKEARRERAGGGEGVAVVVVVVVVVAVPHTPTICPPVRWTL